MAFTFGGVLLALASLVLGCVAIMPAADYRLFTAPEGSVDSVLIVADESGEADLPRSAEQSRIGVLAVALAFAAGLTQLAAALV